MPFGSLFRSVTSPPSDSRGSAAGTTISSLTSAEQGRILFRSRSKSDDSEDYLTEFLGGGNVDQSVSGSSVGGGDGAVSSIARGSGRSSIGNVAVSSRGRGSCRSSIASAVAPRGGTPPKTRCVKKNAKSLLWSHFHVYEHPSYRHLAFCLLCQKDVNYSKTMSTSALTKHLRKFHKEEFDVILTSKAQMAYDEAKEAAGTAAQVSITNYIEPAPSFQEAFLDWLVDTYQPIRCCEVESFRRMCRSLNSGSPIIGRDKVRSLLSQKAAELRVKLRKVFLNRDWCCTTDSWTSKANVNYTVCTAHFIDSKKWLLHHFNLGIFEKEGRATAEDVVAYVEDIWDKYQLSYDGLTCIVTDTEATMIKAGKLFCFCLCFCLS